jgi:predicted ester cyclase
MKYFLLLTLAALFSLSSCSKKAESSSNAQADSMKTAYKALIAAWDAANIEEIEKYISADYVSHNPMPGTKGNLDDMKNMVKMMKAGYPDMKTTVEDLRVDGDILMARWTTTGTNTGSMMGMPATNKKMSDVMGLEMVRWRNGKFVESWFGMEEMKMMQQLGLMPAMSGAAPPADSTKKPM